MSDKNLLALLTASVGAIGLFYGAGLFYGERTLSLTKLEDKIAAAIATVTNEIDRQGLQLAHYSTFNTLNPTGVMPNTQDLSIGAMTDLNARLSEMAAPMVPGSRTLIAGPRLNGYLVRGMAGLFNSPATIGKQNNNGILVPITSCTNRPKRNIFTAPARRTLRLFMIVRITSATMFSAK